MPRSFSNTCFVMFKVQDFNFKHPTHQVFGQSGVEGPRIVLLIAISFLQRIFDLLELLLQIFQIGFNWAKRLKEGNLLDLEGLWWVNLKVHLFIGNTTIPRWYIQIYLKVSDTVWKGWQCEKIYEKMSIQLWTQLVENLGMKHKICNLYPHRVHTCSLC